MKLRMGSFWYDDRMYRTTTVEPGMRMKLEDIESIDAVASCSRRATHSGTGEGSATIERGVVIENDVLTGE